MVEVVRTSSSQKTFETDAIHQQLAPVYHLTNIFRRNIFSFELYVKEAHIFCLIQ